MPIYVVGASNQRVHIPNQAVAVTITGAISGAELDVHASAEQPLARSTAHQVVLPRLTGPVTVAVRPAGTPRFAAGTVVHLAIAHDTSGDVDPVQVLFDPVDVSGEGAVVFASLHPRGPQIEVAVSAVADTALRPLAAAARSAARRVIGRPPQRAEGAAVLAVETSASMRQWFADGSVAAAADIVQGVAAAAGLPHLSAVLVGADITAAPVPAGAGLAEAITALEPRWSAGARWSRLAPGRAHTIVCTDFPTLAVQKRFPVFALSDDRRLDNAGARLPAPRPDHDPAAELLAHPAVLDRITASLVRALT